DRRRMAVSGNLLTHYNYCHAHVEFRAEPGRLSICIKTPSAVADLDASADLSEAASRLPPDSCFATERDARRFAGPLPYTFDYEPQSHSIIAIRGRRRDWHPRLVTAD